MVPSGAVLRHRKLICAKFSIGNNVRQCTRRGLQFQYSIHLDKTRCTCAFSLLSFLFSMSVSIYYSQPADGSPLSANAEEVPLEILVDTWNCAEEKAVLY